MTQPPSTKQASQTKWLVDNAHSSVEFSVRHLALTGVRGRFEQFEGHGYTDAQGELVSVELRIKVASLNTSEPNRDKHLLSADFFNAASYPDITFVSEQVTQTAPGRYEIQGRLTLHGQTHSFSFSMNVTEPIRGLGGEIRVGAEMMGNLRRSVWGLTWNQVLEMGGLAISDDVRLSVNIQVTPEQAPLLVRRWNLNEEGRAVDFSVRYGNRTLRAQLLDVSGWMEQTDGRPSRVYLQASRVGGAPGQLLRLLGNQPITFESQKIEADQNANYHLNGQGRINGHSFAVTLHAQNLALPQRLQGSVSGRVELDIPGHIAGLSETAHVVCWFVLPAVSHLHE